MAARVPSCLPQTQHWSWFSLEGYSLQTELHSNLSQDPLYTAHYFPLHHLSLSFSLDLKLEPHCTSLLFLKHCCYSMALWLCIAWPLQMECLSVISSLTFPRSSFQCVMDHVMFCNLSVFISVFSTRSSCLLFMYFHHRAWQLKIWANIFQVPALYLTRQIISLIPFKNSLREVFLTSQWGQE